MPAPAARTPRLVSFVPRDPATALAALAGGRRRKAIRALALYGGFRPLPTTWLDHSSEDIVAAALGHVDLPVRRLG